jgi:hypothetical protein
MISRPSAQRNVEKYLLNPGMSFGIRAGYVPRIFALAETTGATAGWGGPTGSSSGLGSTPLTVRVLVSHDPGPKRAASARFGPGS